MKRIVLVSCVISSFFSVPLSADTLTPFAVEWARDIKAVAQPEEVELIANLLFWSYERSHTTCVAQQKILEQLNASWHAWHLIYATRRNPSHVEMHQCPTRESIADILETYRANGTTYAHCVEHVVQQRVLPATLHAKVLELRAHCRTHLAQKILSRWSLFQQMIQEAHHAFYEASYHLKNHTLPNKRFSFITTLFSPLMYAAFIKFDTAEIALVDTCWTTFYVTQKTTNCMWDFIETERAQFYRTLYNIFVHQQTPGNIRFNERGFIAPSSHPQPLPTALP